MRVTMNSTAATVAAPSVLVYVGLDLVGDGVLKLPFVRALRAAYPASNLTWLAGRGPSSYRTSLAPLVTGLLDRVIDRAVPSKAPLHDLRKLVGHRTFDVVIDTQRGVLNTLALRHLCHGRFVSAAARFLFSDAKPGRDYRRPSALWHQLLDLLELATGRPNGQAPRLALGEDVTDLARRLLPEPRRRVAIAPGAGEARKRWPITNYLAVAAEQSAAGRVPVILLGPREASLHGAMQQILPGAVFPLQDPAAASFGDRPDLTIAITARCDVAVSNDSGCGHMMGASGTPLISLFGPTDPAKFAPSSPSLTLLRASEWGRDDMAAIPVDAVLAAIERALARSLTRSTGPMRRLEPYAAISAWDLTSRA